MITANRTLNAIDALFSVIEQIERYDYAAIGEKVINITATVAAVIIGVVSYIYTALLLWWEDNGQSVIINAVRFTFIIIDTIGAVYYAGVNSRPVINHWVSRLADTTYRTLCTEM